MPQPPSSPPPTALLAAGVNLVNDVETGAVVAALRRAGMHMILLKGPSVRGWLYEADEPRLSADIDLLVDADALGLAGAVLAGRGYEHLGADAIGPGRPSCDIWQSRERGLLIEFHVTLAGIEVSSRNAWAALSAGTVPMTVGGEPVEVLGIPARAMHVALHAAQHGATHEKTVTDLARALERVPRPTWREAAELAGRLRAVPAFAAGLALLPRGRELLAELGVEAGGSVAAALRASSAPPMAEGLEWLATLRGSRAKAAFLVRQLVPPPGYVRLWLPLARRGRLGLLLGYAWRPLWLLLHAGPALLAWRRARERVRG